MSTVSNVLLPPAFLLFSKIFLSFEPTRHPDSYNILHLSATAALLFFFGLLWVGFGLFFSFFFGGGGGCWGGVFVFGGGSLWGARGWVFFFLLGGGFFFFWGLGGRITPSLPELVYQNTLFAFFEFIATSFFRSSFPLGVPLLHFADHNLLPFSRDSSGHFNDRVAASPPFSSILDFFLEGLIFWCFL